MSLYDRIKTCTHLSAKLACLSNRKLSDLVYNAKPLHSGVGGTSALLTLDDTPIFVKKIPLTDLERQPQHIQSTANLFELPLFCQYGVGSVGFGVWRELAAHLMTTDWVLKGDCPNFPLLYHWCILPTSQPDPMNAEQAESLERDVKYWENSLAVRNRLEAIHNASAHIVLFLEYVPQTLHQWLGLQLKEGENTTESAILFVDQNLKTTNDFMNTRGFSHFDAHFENLLTDGKLVYFSDFGLALSSKFDLTRTELEFLNLHSTYDKCSTLINLLHSVITGIFGKDQWTIKLQTFVKKDQGELAPSIAAMIKQYAPIALIMDKFYTSLQKKSKSTPYPKIQLEGLLAEIEAY